MQTATLCLLFEVDNFSAILGYEEHDTEFYGTKSVGQKYGDLYYDWERLIAGVAPEDSELEVLDPYKQ